MPEPQEPFIGEDGKATPRLSASTSLPGAPQAFFPMPHPDSLSEQDLFAMYDVGSQQVTKCGVMRAAYWALYARIVGEAPPWQEQLPAMLAEKFPQAPWRPISTAPKDGTEILACAHDHGERWFRAVAQWAEADPDFPGTVAGWFWPFAARPTHWMPPPPPPPETGT